jgi:excinuclease ABC subunit A
MPSSSPIRLTNVRSNNLKNICLDIEKNQWLSICGLSGSGKSSLAFDTLYAEGQRRYVECLSPKTRQFIQQMDPPDADSIEGLPPSIAIQPAKANSSNDSVASAAELTPLLSLLFSKVATAICPSCNRTAVRHSRGTIVWSVQNLPPGTRAQICFQLSGDEDLATLLQQSVQAGFIRVVIGPPDTRRSVEISNLKSDANAQDLTNHPILVVVDRVSSGATSSTRMGESIETALYFGQGAVTVLSQAGAGQTAEQSRQITVDSSQWRCQTFRQTLACSSCDHQFPDPRPRIFGQSGSTANSFFLGGLTSNQWYGLKIQDAAKQFADLALTDMQLATTQTLRRRIEDRLAFLNQVGLGYLSLDRTVDTLSSGERQRIRLTAVLSSTLVNMLYVLDEPALGLHQDEIEKLSICLERLHSRGNTLVVVDHNPQLIQAAHRVIEIGPGAGAEGGQVVFDGTPEQLKQPKASLTGEYLAGRSGVACRSDQRRAPKSMLRLTGASGNNLQNVDVEFPLGCLGMVTGVSGSGKSSLLLDTLVGAVSKRKGNEIAGTLPYDDLYGDSPINEIVVVDQSPIGRTGRSNPVTYVKAFDDIRRAFAETVDATTHNLTASHFSFNVNGGRCQKCSGEGIQKIDMQFLADIHIKCDSCGGTRYRKEVLAVRYRDKTIAEVLEMTVREAFLFFRGQPKVQTKLKSLIDVGLEYIRLGQPATTLSSGEAQRLKLALYLNASSKKRVLFVMDEPTTGLHMKDINRLIDCFDTLITAGHSMIAIEHNLQLIKNADYVIDLGPGGGDAGGQVIAAGTPEQIAKCKASVTGQYLKKLLV